MSEFKAERAAFNAAMAKIKDKIRQGTKTSFRQWALAVMAQFKMGWSSRFKSRGGYFRKTFSVRFAGASEQELEAKFASSHKGARLQEYGGTVRPTRRKFLAIPIEGSPALQPTGHARYGFSLYDTLPKGFRFWFVGGPSGGVLMGQKKGQKGGKAQAWYSLRKSVHIPPRLRFHEHIRAAIATLKAQMAQAVKNG
jgi:hypothetical protein